MNHEPSVEKSDMHICLAQLENTHALTEQIHVCIWMSAKFGFNLRLPASSTGILLLGGLNMHLQCKSMRAARFLEGF